MNVVLLFSLNNVIIRELENILQRSLIDGALYQKF